MNTSSQHRLSAKEPESSGVEHEIVDPVTGDIAGGERCRRRERGENLPGSRTDELRLERQLRVPARDVEATP
jgi:hypothetical protein